jgi:hypothetical protein
MDRLALKPSLQVEMQEGEEVTRHQTPAEVQAGAMVHQRQMEEIPATGV